MGDEKRPARERKAPDPLCQQCYRPFPEDRLALVEGLQLCPECAAKARKDLERRPYVVGTFIALGVLIVVTIIVAVFGPIVVYRNGPAYALSQLRQAVSSSDQKEFARLYDADAVRQALVAEATAADAESAARAAAELEKLTGPGGLRLDADTAKALTGMMANTSLMSSLSVDQKVMLVERTVIMAGLGSARIQSTQGDTAVAQAIVTFPLSGTSATFAVQFDMRRVPGPGGTHWKVTGLRNAQSLRGLFT